MNEQNMTGTPINQPPPQQPYTTRRRHDHGGVMGGVIMIVIGLLFLMHNFVPGFNFGDYWPVILIVVGGLLLWRSRADKSPEGKQP